MKDLETSNKLIIMVMVVLLISGLYYQFIYLQSHPTEASLNTKYSNNPELLKSQDQLTNLDRIVIKEAEKRPLLGYLPYTDGYIHISTARTSYHLLVQYTTSLSDANKSYDELLKKYDDTGRYYDVSFRKVPVLVDKK